VYVGDKIIYTWHYVSGLEDGDTIDVITGTITYYVDGSGAIITSNVTMTGEITLDGLIADGYEIVFLPGELTVLNRPSSKPVTAPKTGDMDIILITLTTLVASAGALILAKKKKDKKQTK